MVSFLLLLCSFEESGDTLEASHLTKRFVLDISLVLTRYEADDEEEAKLPGSTTGPVSPSPRSAALALTKAT